MLPPITSPATPAFAVTGSDQILFEDHESFESIMENLIADDVPPAADAALGDGIESQMDAPLAFASVIPRLPSGGAAVRSVGEGVLRKALPALVDKAVATPNTLDPDTAAASGRSVSADRIGNFGDVAPFATSLQSLAAIQKAMATVQAQADAEQSVDHAFNRIDPRHLGSAPAQPNTGGPAGNISAALFSSMQMTTTDADELRISEPALDAAPGPASILSERAFPTMQTSNSSLSVVAAVPRHIDHQMAVVVTQLSEGATEIALSPQELGRVRMQVTAIDGAIMLNVTAERPETADLLRRHAETLAQEFRALGFHDIAFSFGDGRTPDRDSASPATNAVATLTDQAVAEETVPRSRHQPNGSLDLRM